MDGNREPSMPRYLRVYLLGCIAIAFAYLILHAREPLRLNVGDPEADARVLYSIAHASQHGLELSPDPSLPELVYGVLGGALGIDEIGALRFVALAVSALALVLLFLYARRMWSDTVALVAAALAATSFLWLMFADSLHQAPFTQAGGFLALWGLVRAIEARRRRYHAAVFLGALACFLASRDYWLVLPAAMLFTIYSKLGSPLARGHRRFLLICAAGCAAGLLVKALLAGGAGGWPELATLDRKYVPALPTLIRRYTLVFTPLFWLTAGYTLLRVLRAPSPRSVLEDGGTWLLAAAAIFLLALARTPPSQMLGAQPLLPFYAIGSAVLIARLLEGSGPRRSLAVVWIAAAPAWAFYFMLTHPRAVLDRGDVAVAKAYLAASDRNDFVMSNLVSDGPLRATFDRNGWAFEAADRRADPVIPGVTVQLERQQPRADLLATPPFDATAARSKMLEVFQIAGTDYVHAVIFHRPDSRFLDRSLWRLSVRRGQWAMTGYPFLYRRKSNRIIGEYDKSVLKILEAVDAKQVLHLRQFDVYRIERAAVLEAIGRSVPVVRTIDFTSLGSTKHKLLGWADPELAKDDELPIASLVGHAACPEPAQAPRPGEPAGNACKTAMTRLGIKPLDEGWRYRAQLVIRAERACDQRLTLELASPGLARMSINDFTATQCDPAKQMTFLVPERSVRAGINVVTFEKRFDSMDAKVDVTSLAIEPVCGPAGPAGPAD